MNGNGRKPFERQEKETNRSEKGQKQSNGQRKYGQEERNRCNNCKNVSYNKDMNCNHGNCCNKNDDYEDIDE